MDSPYATARQYAFVRVLVQILMLCILPVEFAFAFVYRYAVYVWSHACPEKVFYLGCTILITESPGRTVTIVSKSSLYFHITLFSFCNLMCWRIRLIEWAPEMASDLQWLCSVTWDLCKLIHNGPLTNRYNNFQLTNIFNRRLILILGSIYRKTVSPSHSLQNCSPTEEQRHVLPSGSTDVFLPKSLWVGYLRCWTAVSNSTCNTYPTYTSQVPCSMTSQTSQPDQNTTHLGT